MSSLMEALGIDRLSVAERLQLVEEIWDSIAADAVFHLTDEQKHEIDRRLAAHEANPDEAVPWEVVKSQAEARLRR